MISLFLAVIIWNNQNFWTELHPRPVEFLGNGIENSILFEDGSEVKTKRLSENGEVMKCEWDEAYWWIDMYGNIVYGYQTDDDMVAVSILVSKW